MIGYFTEKCCSVCGQENWDNMTGHYRRTHTIKANGKDVVAKCDTAGEVKKWDSHGHRVYE